MKTLLILLLLAAAGLAGADPAPLSAPVKSWLAAQNHIRTWSADLVQTRTLQSLLEPLKTKGHVWFEAPGRFRWELGRPPKTIAISTLTNLFIIYPRLKRVEIVALGGDEKSPWRSALDMLQAGFPRTEAGLLGVYNIAGETVVNHICQLQLQPRAEALRRMMPRLEVDFDTTDYFLRGTDLEFADGSTMRNDFTNMVENPNLEESLFQPAIPPDYTVVHPQAKP